MAVRGESRGARSVRLSRRPAVFVDAAAGACGGRTLCSRPSHRWEVSMTYTYTRIACAIALGIAAVLPASADSLASSASSAASDSIGSLSDSLRGSSNSSDKKKVAEGDYRITEIAAIAEKPGMLRLTMQPAAREGDAGEL